jgi:hypothetical protein
VWNELKGRIPAYESVYFSNWVWIEVWLDFITKLFIDPKIHWFFWNKKYLDMSSNIFKTEYAQTSMAECNLCDSNILQKDLRIAQLLESKKVNTFNYIYSN